MIRIDKAGKRPDILSLSGTNKGKDKLRLATVELLKEYKENKTAYDSGTKLFKFKKSFTAIKR